MLKVMENTEEKQWYVLQAMYGRALKAEQILKDMEISSFVPMELRVVTIKGRKPLIKLVPIISNLVFADATFTQIKELCTVHNYLYYRVEGSGRKNPLFVQRDSMNEFIDFIKAGGDDVYENLEYINPESFDIKKGELVQISKGPFIGQKGVLVKVVGKHRKQIVVVMGNLLAVTIKSPKPWTIIDRT